MEDRQIDLSVSACLCLLLCLRIYFRGGKQNVWPRPNSANARYHGYQRGWGSGKSVEATRPCG